MSADKIEKNVNLLLKATSAPVLLLNKALDIVDSNAAFNATFGNPSKSFESMIDAIEKTKVLSEISACFSKPETNAHFTTSLKNEKGVKTWIEWTATSDGSLCMIVGANTTKYHRAINELNTQREQFENKKKTEDLFVAKMNHELRTPLNAIIGYSQILLRAGLSETSVDHAQRIRHNGKKLLQQVDNVLSIADVEPELNIEKIDIFPLLQSVVDEFEFSISQDELTVVVEDQRDQDPIDADYSGLRHVIRNLLDNAIKFSSAGEIKLVVQSEQTTAIALHIIDEGVGVSDENVDDIFAPFKKGALLVNDCGVGLGLSVAKKLCATMGFELILDPAKIGSKFTIKFAQNQ